ncbi:MAG: Dabb family protein [Pseudomonadota bacterium]
MIRHHVALRFRAEITPDEINDMMDGLSALREHLDGILDFQHRPNVSVEVPLTHGFLYLFWFDFKDEAARDAYLADPGHQAVGARLVAATQGGPDGILVCDYNV